MHPRHLTPARRMKIGGSLALAGLCLWVAAIVVHVAPASARDVSFAHMEARLLAIVAGGAAVAGGIILAATA